METRQECEAKYGSLGHCVVHELRGDVPPDQAVRIFVMFDRAESAMKAVIDLHGRFFGPRPAPHAAPRAARTARARRGGLTRRRQAAAR